MIANVALSNTFNEFRTTTNEVIGEVNKLTNGTANLSIDSITANTFVGVVTDLDVAGDTGNTTITLGANTLTIAGGSGISSSVSGNTVTLNLETSGVTANTYGSSSKVPVIIVDSFGRITSANTVSVAGVSDFDYYTANSTFVITTADGGNYTASLGQDIGTAANVTFQGLTVTGNLIVTGTTTTISANNLSVRDNLIYLNNDSSNTNVDLGFAGNYNDGTYAHAGFFRDADDGVWKVFDSYLPEPDANVNINTSNSSFAFADFKAHDITSNGIFYGVGSGLTTLNASNVSAGTLLNARTTASTSNGASTIVARDAAGSFSANTITVTDLNSTSDRRLKTNVKVIIDPISVINNLDGVTFDWIKGGSSYGFIAQDVEKILEYAVHTDSEGIKSINYSSVIPYLVESIKVLEARIRDLEQTK
jgi:hypothetical protein